MTPEIVLLLAQDGITTGAIYVLVALGIVLIFLSTRVIFVPFGDIVGYAALTLAALQLKRTPGTVWLVLTLAVIATLMEAYALFRQGRLRRLPRALLYYAALPAIPAAGAWLAAGHDLPMWAAIVITFAVTLPISPLLYRIAFQPIADASILVLLIIAVAVHFVISGMALIFFGPEGFRTEPLTRAFFKLGPMLISGQSILVIASAAVFSLLLFLFFEHTLNGKALRATAVNRIGARLVGIRLSTTAAVAFLLASALAAISGILIGPIATLYYDFGLSHRLESLCRRHHRRAGELSGDRSRRNHGRTVRELRLVLEQRDEGSHRIRLADPDFAVAIIRHEGRRRGGDRGRRRRAPDMMRGRLLVAIAVAVAFIAVAPAIFGSFTITLMNYIGVYAIATLGLVLMTGIGGITSFGQASFIGIGAYATAWYTVTHGGSPWVGLVLGLALTALVATILGAATLRLGGHFLPLSTIAWGIAIYFLFGNSGDSRPL